MEWNEIAKELSQSHVEWFLETIKPLLVEHMIHGFKHGMEYQQENDNQKIHLTKKRK